MITDINIEKIKQYHKQYQVNRKIDLEEKIHKEGLQKQTINFEVLKENPFSFNIELPKAKISNQNPSEKCWIYAGLNFIKYNIAENLKYDIEKFELSNNYVTFYDKLEKANAVYEYIINSHISSLEQIQDKKFLLNDLGYFEFFKQIIQKYGIVPYEIMPDTYDSKYSKIYTLIFEEKVKKDILSIIQLKQQQENIQNLEKLKEQFVYENYSILSKLLGEPPLEFSFQYVNKKSEKVEIQKIDPLAFKNQFLTLDLNTYIAVANFKNKQYEKLYTKEIGNVNMKLLNLPIERIKELVAEQIINHIPVFIGVDTRKLRDHTTGIGIYDSNLYQYDKILEFTYLNKKEAQNFNQLIPYHAMVITGLNKDNKGEINRWKIENEVGTQRGYEGYYIMTNSFFEDYLIEAIIREIYLTKEERNVLKGEGEKIKRIEKII